MITLLVDEIEPGGMLAKTTHPDKFIYNLQRLGSEYYHSFQEKVTHSEKGQYMDMLACGRYIVIILQSVVEGNNFMLFYDTKNNPEDAFSISDKFLKFPDGQHNQRLFLKAFSILASNYDSQYSDVCLTMATSVLC